MAPTTHGSARAVGTFVLAGLGVWLAGATTAALPAGDGVLGVVLARPRPWMIVAALTLGAVSIARRSYWPALVPALIAGAPLLLPWVPAAWVFAGEAMTVIWVVLALGVGVAGHRWRARPIAPGRQALAAVLLGVVWLAGIAVALDDVAMTGDAPHYLTIAQSLIDDGDVDLKNNYDQRTYASFYRSSLEPRHTNVSPWGEHYSFHGLGVAVLVAPGMAGAGASGATATLVLLMAMGGGLLWLAAWELTGHAGAAWFGWSALLGSAPYALHAAAIYADGPAAVAVAAALWLLARLQRQQAVALRALSLGSVGLAALPWLHVRFALVAAILGAAIVATVLMRQPERWTRASWFLMVPIPSAAGWFAAAYVMFGTWNPARAMLQRTAPGHWDAAPAGLLGLLADQEFGLFPAAPVMLGALAAYPGVARAFPLIATSTGLLTVGVLGMSSLWMWWGGDSAPARFLTVVLPILALWLAHLWATASGSVRRLLSVAVAASAGLTVLYATLDGGTHAYNFANGRGSIFEALSHSVDLSLALPSLHRVGATPGSEVPLALVWFGAAVAVSAVVVLVPASLGPARAWALGALLVLAGVSSAAGVAWRLQGVDGWTPGSAAHALLLAAARPDVVASATGWPPTPLPRERLMQRVHVITPEWVPMERPTLLHIPNVPAGDYRVHVVPGSRDAPPTQLSLELGREAWPWATWPLGTVPPVFSLETDVHSVRVQGDADAAGWLEPLALRPAASLSEARRVTRMGTVVVYSMDDNSYVEHSGAWTGGDRTTAFLLSAPERSAVSMRVESGPAAVDVKLAGTWGVRELRLGAGSSEAVSLTSEFSAPIELRVTVRNGFPASLLGNPADARTLGVWVSFSATPPE